MSEARQVRKHAGWYASYTENEQGKALIECMDKRIKADDELFKQLEELLVNDSLDNSAITNILNSREEINHKRGYFIWTC